MRVKIEGTLKKSRSKTSRWLNNLTEKLRPERTFAHFSTSNNSLLNTELTQIQPDSNQAKRAEAERQQNNGLIYTNIVRFR